jgi:hypothetical protein
MKTDEYIVWAAPDGSWGACETGDLVVVPMDKVPEFFEDDISEDEVYQALRDIRNNLEKGE